MSIKSLLAAALILCAGPALAQSPAGKWTATLINHNPQGPMELTYQFNVEPAGALTGTVGNPALGSVAIQKGKVAGNRVSFTVSWTAPNGMPLAVDYTGTLKGDELELHGKELHAAAGTAREFTVVAKRIK